MARHKLISDTSVLNAVLAIFGQEGSKGVSFGTVGKVTGLAPATLVQRFVSRDAMFAMAIAQGWALATEALERCEAAMAPNGQNAVAMLKQLGDSIEKLPLSALLTASQPNPVLRAKASDWRRAVEASLIGRIQKGQGPIEENAAAVFAAWQGRMMWQGTEGGDFRLRSILKKKQA